MWKVCKVGLVMALLGATLLAVPSAHAEWEQVKPNDGGGTYMGPGDPEPELNCQGEPDEPFDRVGQFTVLEDESTPVRQRSLSLSRLVALITLSVLRWTAP